MGKKKRGNDAIPTWSGFNYQGKITLLCVLLEINQLILKGYKPELLDDCHVEIEKTEDFVLVVQGKVKALYQVKAYLSTDKTASFLEAIKKLIEHRSELKSLAAECYICAPLMISDWENSENSYKNQIKLFLYDKIPVHITKVAEKIKMELEKVLISMGLDTKRTNDIYLGLCSFLDEKVLKMHEQGAKKRDYTLSFGEMANFIIDANSNYKIEQSAVERENIYNHIINNFNNVIENYCSNECENKQLGTCKKDIYGSCTVTTSYDYMLQINIWEYCKYLNPHIIAGWDKQLNYISRLSENDFKNLLLPIFKQINEEELYVDDETIYCSTNIFETVKNRVIPTLLTFDAGYNDISRSVIDKLNKIKQNSFLSSSAISGCAITADTKGYQYNTEEDSILYFGKEENNITDNDSYIKIIDGGEFIRRIGGTK